MILAKKQVWGIVLLGVLLAGGALYFMWDRHRKRDLEIVFKDVLRSYHSWAFSDQTRKAWYAEKAKKEGNTVENQIKFDALYMLKIADGRITDGIYKGWVIPLNMIDFEEQKISGKRPGL